MKKFIILFVIILFVGCRERIVMIPSKYNRYVIYEISPQAKNNTKLSLYKASLLSTYLDYKWNIDFVDIPGKYNAGDTIMFHSSQVIK